MPNELRLQFPDLFPKQAEIAESRARFNVVAGGRQSGKMALAVDVLLTSRYGALQGHPVGFLVPDADTVMEAKRRVFSLISPLLVGRLDKPRVELVGGGSITFLPLDNPDFQFWDQLAMLVVFDAQKVDGLVDLWEKVLRPLLARFRGPAWFFGKPAGVRNGFAHLAMLADLDPEWLTWCLASTDNPHLDRAELKRDEAAMQPDVYRQEVLAQFIDSPIELSAAQTVIGRDETFVAWCDRLARDGLRVDGHPFTLESRPAMRFIYEQIPSSIEEAHKRTLVLMKCAQVGFTVMEILAMIYMALKFMPTQIGMYLPDQNLARIKSSERFMPIVRTIGDAYRILLDRDSTGTARGGEGNIMIRNMGTSRFYFLWTSGKGSTESVPLDVLALDEVQEMDVADMEKVAERMSASRIRYTLAGSTANWPDRDIHFLYKRGTQHQFHTSCPSCAQSNVLDEYFPECIGYDVDRREYRYVCRHCNGWIDEPQRGQWVPKTPDAEVMSIHFPQFLSPTISARDIIQAYYNADDLKNFYNRKLGKPFMDPSQVPVNMEMLNDCAAEGQRLGVRWKERATGTYMGIDQMGAFNVVLIAERLPSGHQAIIHAEEIYDDDPFQRCSTLIENYGVVVCVVETLPNYNDAKRFAGRHPGVVFLAGYGNMDGEMMLWGDSVPTRMDRKTEEEDRDRYTVRLDQYKVMQVAMARIQKRQTVFPDPKGLIQDLTEKGTKGVKVPTPILSERVFLHFTRTALVAEKDDEEHKYRRRVVKVGIDPHFSYAYMLLNVAWARAHGTTGFIMPEIDHSKFVEIGGAATNDPKVLLMRDLRARETAGTCGGCTSYEDGHCRERFFRVQFGDLACDIFTPLIPDA